MSDSVAEQKPTVDEVSDGSPAITQQEQDQQVDTPATEPEEDVKSKKVTLADLSAKGTRLYGNKQYDEAADIFARAAELQAELNGDEINPENAEILFLYGRSLFKVGQSKSDVLGGKAPTEAKPEKPKKKAPAARAAAAEESKTDAEKVTQEGVAAIAEATSGAQQPETTDSKKPLFQFEGDENFDQSDDEEGEDADEEGEEEEEDDLQVAHDILEVARVSYQKHLEQLTQADAESSDKGKEVSSGDDAMTRHVKERLADTHDLLAEIHLENENFPAAAVDSRASLKFKKELYPPESEILAEAHFKLSLALEFASVTTTKEEQGAEGDEQAPFDEELRAEAISELEAAIASTRLKLQAKEVELAEMASPEENVATKASISDVRDIIEDMEQRLKEMKKPPVDLQATLEAATGGAMQGILGSVLGETSAQTEARIEEAKKTATDLTGLVRKKKKEEEPATAAAPAEAPANGTDSNGTKRKAEEPVDEDVSKKAKVEEAKAEETA